MSRTTLVGENLVCLQRFAAPRSWLNLEAKPQNINLVQQKFVPFSVAVYHFGTDKGKLKSNQDSCLFVRQLD
jgi:hypothetical protein